MRYTTLLVSMLLLIRCTNQQNNDQSGQKESTTLGAATLKKAAQKRIQHEIEEGIPRRVGGRISSSLYDQLPRLPTAFRQYLLDHKDEIQQTFKVAQVDSVRDYGVALYRFSISSNIIRGNYEMARYDSLWYPTSVYLGSDEKESLPPDILRRYEAIKEKRVEWMENSTPIFPPVELFK